MAKKRAQGEGGIYPEKGGGYRVVITINGVRIRRRAETEEAAQAVHAELLAQKNKGISVDQGGQSLATWLETWQELKARNWSARNTDNNATLINGYLVPLLGDYALNRITADRIQRTLNQVQDDIARESDGKHSGVRTVRALAQVLRASFDLAVNRRLIDHNPMDGVELPTYRATEKIPLDDAALRAVLTAEHLLVPMWGLCALLGLRRGEVMGLRWQDVDMAKATVNITQQVQEINSKLVIGAPKYDSRRLLPLPRSLIEPLRRRRVTQLALRLKRADTWVDHDLIFCSRDGKPMWPSNVEDDWRALCAAQGISAGLHTLRHTVATLLDECGATDALKAGILGHGKKNVTLKYTHARITAMRRVLDAVEARLLGDVDEQAKEG